MARGNIGSQTGYLPNDTPQPAQLILLGFHHVITMFPVTIFVAALTRFHVGPVLLASGVSTIVALFYGSSFSYIAAYLGIINHLFAKSGIYRDAADFIRGWGRLHYISDHRSWVCEYGFGASRALVSLSQYYLSQFLRPTGRDCQFCICCFPDFYATRGLMKSGKWRLFCIKDFWGLLFW